MVFIETKFTHSKQKIFFKYLLFNLEIQLKFLAIQKKLNDCVNGNNNSPAIQSQSVGKIVTFGYGNRKDYDSFLHYLQVFEVKSVVDVRLNPRAWSRKWYGDSIAKFCELHNIEYSSQLALGNTSGSKHWIPPEDQDVKNSLLNVAEMLKKGSVLLLCAEMDSERCHRTEVAEKLQSLTKAPIEHLK